MEEDPRTAIVQFVSAVANASARSQCGPPTAGGPADDEFIYAECDAGGVYHALAIVAVTNLGKPAVRARLFSGEQMKVQDERHVWTSKIIGRPA